jgi:acetylglutamate kinase
LSTDIFNIFAKRTSTKYLLPYQFSKKQNIKKMQEKINTNASNGQATLTVVKVGGKIVEEEPTLKKFLHDFAAIEGHKVLVHGGGRSATAMATQLGIESVMVKGRRVTDAETLKVVTMVYGGLVNKNIVAQLQAMEINALGLTGADMNYMQSAKRPVGEVDYGYVGDVKKVNAGLLADLIDKGIVPVLAPLTHDKKGHLLNTNADTIAGEVAKALAAYFDVTLIYCFEKKGVLHDATDDDSVISEIDKEAFANYVADDTIQGGMIPKLENAFEAIDAGVRQVIITKADAIDGKSGTKVK